MATVKPADNGGVRHAATVGENDLASASGARRAVPAEALFVLIGAQPRTQWLGEAIARDRWGFIRTGADLPTGTHARRPAGRPPLPLETSLPGGVPLG